MKMDEKSIMNILNFVNDSDYGYLNLEVEDIQLSAIKWNMDLTELSNFVNNDKKNVGASSNDKEIQKVTQEEVKQGEKEENKSVSKNPKYTENQFIVKAPMLGTFFRRPTPDEAEYAIEGDSVEEKDTICLIEVMKLFNSVPAGGKGKVIEFLAEDGDMVEYNQPICIIELEND